MPFAWRPAPGQVALIEVVGLDDCLTGVVLDATTELAEAARAAAADDGEPGGSLDGAVAVDLGASPGPPEAECEVIASFFAPDALYRITATAVPRSTSAKVIDLRVHDVERVQRRSAPRARLTIPAVLSNFDDPGSFLSVLGETIDVGEGGCRVRTAKAFPSGCDPTVTLSLPNGPDIVTLGAVLQSLFVDGAYEYRIVFLEVDDDDRSRLARVVTELAAA